MKSQYFGDLNDFRKYGLLRHISGNGEIKIGVCWMLTEGVGWVSNEHESEGASKFQYLVQPEKWRHYDPDLFDFLRGQIEKDRRSVDCIENGGLLACTTFFSQPLNRNYQDRRSYFKKALEFFAEEGKFVTDPIVAYVLFTDGAKRPVYQEASGRQYVFDEGEKVYGVWYLPPEERLGPDLVVDCGDEDEIQI